MKVFEGFRLSSEGELSEAELVAAKKLAVDTRLEAKAKGLFQYRKYIKLEDGGTAFAVLAGDYLRVHVIPVEREQEELQVPLELPDWGSGWVVDGELDTVVVDGETVNACSFVPTTDTVARLDDIVDPGFQLAPRYGIEQVYEAPGTGETQYGALTSAMYSGAMQKLVQYLLGYGKPPRARNKLAKLLYGPAGSEPPVNPDVLDAFENGVHIRHRFDWGRTHGLCRGPNNSWWIIEVGDRGVYAMPLQYFRGTTSGSFRARARAIDAEVAAVIDLFGGLPNATSIPSDTGYFNCLKRAGIVLELLPESAMDPFYFGSGLSTAHGWAFNASGTEAHNVMVDSVAIPQGQNPTIYRTWSEHWKVEFAVTSTTLPIGVSNEDSLRLNSMLRAANAPSDAYRKAVLSKVAFLNASQIATGAAMTTAAAAFAYVDGLEVVRATGTATATMVQRGYTSRSSAATAQLDSAVLKYSEPYYSDCRLLTYEPGDAPPPPGGVYDAVLFVYFIGDTLRRVRMFRSSLPGTPVITCSGWNTDIPCNQSANCYWVQLGTLIHQRQWVKGPQYHLISDAVGDLGETDWTITNLVTRVHTYEGRTQYAYYFWGDTYYDHYVDRQHSDAYTYPQYHRVNTIIPAGVRHGTINLVSTFGTVTRAVESAEQFKYSDEQHGTITDYGPPIQCAVVTYPKGCGTLPSEAPPTHCDGGDFVTIPEGYPDPQPAAGQYYLAHTGPAILPVSYEVIADFELLPQTSVATGDASINDPYIEGSSPMGWHSNFWPGHPYQYPALFHWYRPSGPFAGFNLAYQFCRASTNCFGDKQVLVFDVGPTDWEQHTVHVVGGVDEYIEDFRACFVGVVN